MKYESALGSICILFVVNHILRLYLRFNSISLVSKILFAEVIVFCILYKVDKY